MERIIGRKKIEESFRLLSEVLFINEEKIMKKNDALSFPSPLGVPICK